MEQLEHAMNREMKRYLIYQIPYPNTYEELASRCIQIESRERSLGRDFRTPTTPRPPPQTPAKKPAPLTTARTEVTTVQKRQYSQGTLATGANTTPIQTRTTSQGGDAMDLSGRRGPISDAEKQRRLDESLCLYCGEPGHIARNCTQKGHHPLQIRVIEEVEADSGKD